MPSLSKVDSIREDSRINRYAHRFRNFSDSFHPSRTLLSLAISYQIIETHSGSLRCVSQPGQGTEFAIEIPVKAKIKLPIDSGQASAIAPSLPAT